MAELIRIYEENPNPKAVERVVKVLRAGGLVIYPTDTVYGLGCDITNSKALQRLARILHQHHGCWRRTGETGRRPGGKVVAVATT